MKDNPNTYTRCGLALLIAGILSSPFSYFVLNTTWLTAMGFSLVIIGVILLALGRSLPGLSPEMSRLLFISANDSLSDLLEELGISARAIFLPSAMTTGKPQALLPLNSSRPVFSMAKLRQQRLIVRYGKNPGDIGLMLSTPGTVALQMLRYEPIPGSSHFESILRTLFQGILDAAQVKRVFVHERQITITLEGLNFNFDSETNRAARTLGSPLAAIAATLAAEAWGQPVSIASEQGCNKKYIIELRVLGEDI